MLPNNPPIPVTVVVCTRNRGWKVVATIESILANQYPSFEILLVDQSTNAETREAVEIFKHHPDFCYIQSSETGAANARNLGLRMARSEYVFFTDDDCTVPVDWLDQMLKAFLNNQAVAMVFCNVLAGPHNSALGFIPTYQRQDDLLATSVKDKRFSKGIGAGMGLRRSVALTLGGFDPKLGPGSVFPACEEGDLAVRALLKGWYIFETSQVAVVHHGFRTWYEGKALSKRNYYGIGAAYSKPIKCQYWEAWDIVLDEGVEISLLQPLKLALKTRRARGLKNFMYFWQGFFQGLITPVDKNMLLFQ
jgi:glycosyltransferase involved in cell wall biosynthesis